MKQETYDYMFENALERAIQDVLKGISVEIQEKYSLKCAENMENKKKQIFDEYLLQRERIREKFFDKGEDGKKLIDVHKVSACFTAAVLKVGVFSYEKIQPMNMSIFYSNYTLAFLTGLHIMYLCLMSDYYDEKEDELVDLLNKQGSLVFPETNKGHDDYLVGRVKTLAINDLNDVDFDVLTYADMLFWIEKYNKDELLKRKSG